MKTTGFPFRLGTTSYIYTDHILPNVRKLQHLVDDIELVLFEADDQANLPGPEELAELRAIAAAKGLTYTVHFPIDLYLGDFDETVRRESVAKARRVMQLTESLRPFSYNLHFEKRDRNGSAIKELLTWKRHLRQSCRELCDGRANREVLCVETLNYPLELVSDILEAFGFSVILDLGHLMLYGMDFEAYLNKFLSRTRVIHLHGVNGGKDHLSLAKSPTEDLRRIFEIVKEQHYRHVLTLEVFSKSDLDESMQVLRELWPT